MQWHNIWRGMMMGTTEVIPGISSGTIAMVLGIYERFIAAINGLFSKHWKQSLRFLIPLGAGMVLAVFAMARIIEWVLRHYPDQLYFFFIGLIFGIIPYLMKKIDYRRSFSMPQYVLLLLAAGAVIWAESSFGANHMVIQNPTLRDYIGLFCAGWIASSIMILPGFSGAFVLVLLGYFETVISAVSNFNLPIIFTVVAGIIIGLAITSKLVHYVLHRFPINTYAIAIGLVFGSAIAIFPGLPTGSGSIIACFTLLLCGLGLALFLGRVEHE